MTIKVVVDMVEEATAEARTMEAGVKTASGWTRSGG